MSEIVDPNTNKPVAQAPSIPVIRINDKSYPFRTVDRKALIEQKLQPFNAFVRLTEEVNDRSSVLFMCMLELAKDIYERQPEGSRHFQKLCETVGLQVADMDGGQTVFAVELAKIGAAPSESAAEGLAPETV